MNFKNINFKERIFNKKVLLILFLILICFYMVNHFTVNNTKAELIEITSIKRLLVKHQGNEKNIRLLGIVPLYTNEDSLIIVKQLQLEEGLKKGSKLFLISEKLNKINNNSSVYVFLSNGDLLNEKLILSGFAKLSEENIDLKYKTIFEKALDNAKSNKTGYWSN